MGGQRRTKEDKGNPSDTPRLNGTLSRRSHHRQNKSIYQALFKDPGGSEVKASASNVGDQGSIPGLGRSPGEGNGNPLQYSCLEHPMDGGAWQATVHGITKSRTRLSDFTFTKGGQIWSEIHFCKLLLFSHSVMSESLLHHALQHTRLPSPSPSPGERSPIQPSHPLSCPSPPASIFPSISVFSNESALHIRWKKYWSFSFSISFQ